MRNIIFLTILLLFIAGCNKNGSDSPTNPSNNNSGSSITIKGTIAHSSSAKISGSKSGKSLTLADARKVLVFNGNHYNLFEITNGSFSIDAKMGTANALVFLDTNNSYIGNLCEGGLNVLPLVSLTDGGNTTIDLSTLTLTGDSVISSHDPLGAEIGITDAEITGLKAISGYYASLAKNIDADNDGVPDILSNRQLTMSTVFAISVGNWGFNNTPASWTDTTKYYFNYSVCINGGTGLTFSNSNIVLSGPVESPYNDITTWGSVVNTSSDEVGFLATFARITNAPASAPWQSTFLPFKKGTYTLTLDGSKSYTLDYSNIDMKNNLVFVIPTLHTDSTGKLASITFDYKLPNGTAVRPENILTDIMIQLVDINRHLILGTNHITGQTNFATYTLSSPLDISQLQHMDLWYDDIIGNQYDIIWQ